MTISDLPIDVSLTLTAANAVSPPCPALSGDRGRNLGIERHQPPSREHQVGQTEQHRVSNACNTCPARIGLLHSLSS